MFYFIIYRLGQANCKFQLSMLFKMKIPMIQHVTIVNLKKHFEISMFQTSYSAQLVRVLFHIFILQYVKMLQNETFVCYMILLVSTSL